jgi:hypothetical protein
MDGPITWPRPKLELPGVPLMEVERDEFQLELDGVTAVLLEPGGRELVTLAPIRFEPRPAAPVAAEPNDDEDDPKPETPELPELIENDPPEGPTPVEPPNGPASAGAGAPIATTRARLRSARAVVVRVRFMTSSQRGMPSHNAPGVPADPGPGSRSLDEPLDEAAPRCSASC